MTTELETSKPGCSTVGFFVWFIGGLSLSFSIIFSLALLILLIASIALNVYLGWQLSGLQITISRPTPLPPQIVTVISTAEAMVQAPAETPTVAEVTTPTPVPPEVEVERQVETVAAIVTQAAAGDAAAFAPPTATIAAAPLDPSAPTGEETQAGEETALAAPTPAAAAPKGEPAASSEQAVRAPVTSSNSYQLIPIEGQRESRPAEEHGDLNLKLREPQPIEVELALVDAGVGIDPDAPKLSKIFKPEFTAAYTVHDWNWGCNCKGKLIEEKEVVLVGLKTTPGEPVYIPPREQDIYGGQYYAVVLYASEDSLTFLYNRVGSVVQGYTIHYLGLQTDPNLVALFRESQGSELPGLSLDVPVGVASDELIIAIRDNGKFLDVRSKNDWWD